VLADIHGKPMLWHVWIGCSRPQVFDCGHHRHRFGTVWQAVTDWGGHAVMTSPACRSGMERIARCRSTDADLIVNCRATKRSIPPAMLNDLGVLWQAKTNRPDYARFRLTSLDEVLSPPGSRSHDGSGRSALLLAQPDSLRARSAAGALLDKSPFGDTSAFTASPRCAGGLASLPLGQLEQASSLNPHLRFLEGATISKLLNGVSSDCCRCFR